MYKYFLILKDNLIITKLVIKSKITIMLSVIVRDLGYSR